MIYFQHDIMKNKPRENVKESRKQVVFLRR